MHILDSENNGYPHFAIQIPTVNFSSSATTTMNLTYPNVAAAHTVTTLPEEYNPNIPPPTLPNSLKAANFEEKKQKNDIPITPVQALLQQYSNEDKELPKSQVCYPDSKVREQHRRHIQRNGRRNTNELDDNYRKPLQFFNSTILTTKRRRSRSRSPHNQFQQLNQINFGRNSDDSKLKFSKSAANSDKIRFL
uniref:Uncharacterized protein n=1 Tax=Panagrolaimus superbus TaxID=310955 RepID=A0A914YVB9_9BILA